LDVIHRELVKARRKIADVAATDRFNGHLQIAAQELVKHGKFVTGFKQSGKPYFYWPTVLQHGRAFSAIVDVFRDRYVGFRGKLIMVHSGGLVFGPVLLRDLQLPEGLVFMPTANVPSPKYETQPYRTAYASRGPLAIGHASLKGRNGDPDDHLAIVIDDAVEDGGTALSVCDLLEAQGFRVVEVACLYAIGDTGREALARRDIPVFSIRTETREEILARAEEVTPA
jgi:adenine/guanine phosphoribosyltransferase-like PRPP-binding protein